MDFGTIHRGAHNTGSWDHNMFWISVKKRGELLPPEPVMQTVSINEPPAILFSFQPPLARPGITGFETKLLEALRAYPDRLEMWLKEGNPLRNHRNLIALYTGFFEICNANGIEYWLEFGSLLGYVRHKGIIPWEWDMDVGCTSAHFRTLLDAGTTMKRDHPLIGFRHYQHPEYGDAGYSFYLKSDPDILCDIAEYRQEGDKLVCTAASWNYPSHRVEDILPVRRVTMLGESHDPARPEMILRSTQTVLGQYMGDGSLDKNRIGYEQYDPVPFLLTHLYHPESAERLCSAPFVDVGEASSIAEGFETFGYAGCPFVVRNCRIADIAPESFVRRLEAADGTVFGWGNEQELVGDLRLRDVVNDWKQDALAANVIDAPIAELFTGMRWMRDFHRHGIAASSLMLVLTNRLTYTPFHQDRPTEGGGWMWLAEGQKLWNLIDFEDCDLLFDGQTKTLPDLVRPNFSTNTDMPCGAVRGKRGSAPEIFSLPTRVGSFCPHIPAGSRPGRLFGAARRRGMHTTDGSVVRRTLPNQA